MMVAASKGDGKVAKPAAKKPAGKKLVKAGR
jgi:hypothetical protein